MVNPGRDTARPLYPPGFDQATTLAKIAAGATAPGTPASSVQYNNAGAFGGSAKTAIDANGSANIGEYSTTDPTVPSTGVTLIARKRANRDLLGFVGPTGLSAEVGLHWATRGIAFAKATGGSTATLSGQGFSNTSIGTPTVGGYSAGGVKDQAIRLIYTSAAGAGSSCGWLNNTTPFWLGNAANLGGFHIVIRFAFGTMPATVRFFCGITDSTTALANAQPSTNTNLLGVAFDTTDANLQLIESSAVSFTKHNAGFSWDTTSIFELRLYCKANDTKVDASIQKLPAGTLFEATLNTTIPLATQFLSLQLWLNNATTASAAAIHFISAYAETDY